MVQEDQLLAERVTKYSIILGSNHVVLENLEVRVGVFEFGGLGLIGSGIHLWGVASTSSTPQSCPDPQTCPIPYKPYSQP